MKTYAILALFLVLSFGAAAVGGLFQAGEWYAGLSKPSWTPPNWVFGPVWTVLYVLIGVSGWLLWRRTGWAEGRLALSLYGLQLVLNAAWPWLYFGLHRAGLAFAEIVLLWLAILETTVVFWRSSRPAAYLLIPYLGWVGFAAVLNFALWRMNV